MSATYTYAAHYRVCADCLTPLRTGGVEKNAETILRDHHGRAMIQAASVAGALRGWLSAAEGPTLAAALFGSQEESGRLLVSDAYFSPQTVSSLRSRLSIDGKSGSAAERKKFDLAQVNAGSRFSFTLTWLGSAAKLHELSVVEDMLSALHHGCIRLGGQKSNGFGRVKLTVCKQVFDLYDEADRQAWLDEDSTAAQPLSLPDANDKQQVVFLLSGTTDSILVKAPAASQGSGNDSVIVNLSEGERSLLPGSSIKGAVRACALSISDQLGLPPEIVENLWGRGARGEDTGKAGVFRFEDVELDGSKGADISRIRINRFSGGVMRQGLFTEHPLCGNIQMRITAPASQPAGCALLLYALRDLALGLYNLGSGGAIGRGYIKVRQIQVAAPQGQATLSFSTAEGCRVQDEAGIFSGWLQALELLGGGKNA